MVFCTLPITVSHCSPEIQKGLNIYKYKNKIKSGYNAELFYNNHNRQKLDGRMHHHFKR